MLPSLNIVTVVAALVGAFGGGALTWGAMRVREAIVVSGAVAGERQKQVGICQQQLVTQAITMERNVTSSVATAGDAADRIAPTPTVPAELVALCKADPTCRSRETLP